MAGKRMPSARELIGRKIVGFDLRPFDSLRGGVAHRPIIYLDDGSSLDFITEETETGDYGVFVNRMVSKSRKGRKRNG